MSSNKILSFEQLDLSTNLLRAVSEEGYTTPTAIQEQAIPVILAGKDVMGAAQTGTGKTASFTLPMLQRLEIHANNSASPARHPVRALILVPTRELALQVFESVKTYGKYSLLKSAVIYGGVNIDTQIEALRSGVEILVATPGRLMDHLQQKNLVLSKVEIFVLDEADRMLDMGFLPDIKQIIELLPEKRQNLMFSATFSEEIKKLASKILIHPATIEVAKQNSVSDLISHVLYPVDTKRKQEFLVGLISQQALEQVLIFTRTKHSADRLVQQLCRRDITCAAIHGDRNQSQRTKALEDFKQGLIRILVATDVAARGLDIEDLTHVINFELPGNPEDYVHRIGRTGRAGRKGTAISLVSREENKLVASIEKLIGFKLKVEQMDRKDELELEQSLDFNAKTEATEQKSKSGVRNRNKNIHSSVRNHENIVPFNKGQAVRNTNRKNKTNKNIDPLFTEPYVSKYPVMAENDSKLHRATHRQHARKPVPALFISPAIRNKVD
ncbi:DEAD/DEAH box helicase [Nitrosomonas sp.]|uniref:DEAD/DEAH box helicase n=1 Tax=Nitrosomonas sp. TaxID=42353 RepID=UPI001D6E3E35|nr:DEAD/DEAH box helicase [Nitrosomonas sp.]MBX3618327.1 DEAD/DEAH box helicase [Nitrosomonas sp.]